MDAFRALQKLLRLNHVALNTNAPSTSTKLCLPLDVIEVVLGHLHNDQPSLKSCTLVCRAWTYPARLQLFSKLTIHLVDGRELHLRAASMFQFVRRLNVKNHSRNWDSFLHQLKGLKRIKFLHLFDMSVDRDKSSALSRLNDLSCVVTLRFERVFFLDMPAFAEFVCAFRCLQTLSIGGSFWKGKHELKLPRSNAYRLSPDLIAMEINSPRMDALLEWFLSLSIHPPFRAVSLHNIPKSSLFLGKFLVNMKDSLQSFSFSTNFNDDEPWPPEISYLSDLRSLQMGLADTHWRQTQWITQTLSCMSSVHLTEVIFVIDVTAAAGLRPNFDCVRWDEVDVALQHSAFAKLEKVEVSCVGWQLWLLKAKDHWQEPEGGRSLSERIMNLMPKCAARGILGVRQIDWGRLADLLSLTDA